MTTISIMRLSPTDLKMLLILMYEDSKKWKYIENKRKISAKTRVVNF